MVKAIEERKGSLEGLLSCEAAPRSDDRSTAVGWQRYRKSVKRYSVRQEGAVVFVDIAAPPIIYSDRLRPRFRVAHQRAELTVRFKCLCSRAPTRTTSSRTST